MTSVCLQNHDIDSVLLQHNFSTLKFLVKLYGNFFSSDSGLIQHPQHLKLIFFFNVKCKTIASV